VHGLCAACPVAANAPLAEVQLLPAYQVQLVPYPEHQVVHLREVHVAGGLAVACHAVWTVWQLVRVCCVSVDHCEVVDVYIDVHPRRALVCQAARQSAGQYRSRQSASCKTHRRPCQCATCWLCQCARRRGCHCTWLTPCDAVPTSAMSITIMHPALQYLLYIRTQTWHTLFCSVAALICAKLASSAPERVGPKLGRLDLKLLILPHVRLGADHVTLWVVHVEVHRAPHVVVGLVRG
jgi:hypothetical protein